MANSRVSDVLLVKIKNGIRLTEENSAQFSEIKHERAGDISSAAQ